MENLQMRDSNHAIAFRSVKLPLPLQVTSSPLHNSSPSPPPMQVPSFCFKSSKGPAPKPILDIEDVRAFLRSRLGSPKQAVEHSSSSSGRRVRTGVFGIGTMGSSGSDGGYVYLSSPQANEQQGQISSRPFTTEQDRTRTESQAHPEHVQNVCVQCSNGHLHDEHVQKANIQPDKGYEPGCPPATSYGLCTPFLDIEDVRYTLDIFLHRTGLRRHSDTSLANKMPWHVPRAPFLARGLEWPPDTFESEEARKVYYRKARKRKPFLLGSPPLWTVTAFNLAFLQLLMYNPLQKLSDFLSKLP